MERKLTAKESEKRSRDIALCAGDFIWEIDRKGKYTYASDGVRKILGYSPSELIGRSPMAFICSDEREKIRKNVKRLFQRKAKIVDIVNWNISKAGKKVCLLTNGVPILSASGELLGYHGTDKDITRTVEAQSELDKQHRFLIEIIESLPDPVFVIDAERRIVAWNRAMEKLTGFKKKQMLGKGNHQYAIPFYGRRVPVLVDLLFNRKKESLKKYAQLRFTRNSVSGIKCMQMRGSQRYLWGIASLLYDRNGKINGAIECLRDITLQREEHAELEKLAHIPKHSNEVMFLADPTGRIVFMNPKGCRMLGVTKRLCHAKDITPRRLWGFTRDVVFTSVFKHGHWQGEYQLQNLRTGKVFDLYSTVYPISLDGHGKPEYMGCISFDISARRKAELLLKENKDKYESIFRNAGEVILIRSPEGRIIDVNDAIMRYGLRKDDLIGRSASSFVHKEDMAKMDDENSLNRRGKPTEGNLRLKTPRGDRVFSYKDTPIRKEGRFVGIQTILTDITELKEAEETLRKQNKELQKKEAQILKVNRKLEQANKELLALHEVKDNFLSNVSHELKTPLTTIKSYNQILRSGMLGPINKKQEEAISIALTSAEHLNTFINDLLDVSRYEAGKKEFIFSHVEFRPLVTEVLAEFQPTLDSIGAMLEVSVSDIWIRADSDKIKEVFRNLISNSIKYRSDKPLIISISIRKVRGSVHISFKDNGIGIPRKSQAQVFNKFYQVDQGLTKKTEGTGLGLSIVKHILVGHNGMIDVVSSKGKGTEFRIYLHDTQK